MLRFLTAALVLAGCSSVPGRPALDPPWTPSWQAPAAPKADLTDGLDVDEAVALALAANPRFRAAQLEVDLARARKVTAETYPYNPELGIEGARAMPFGSADDFAARLAISQTFETGGQRRHRIAAADADIERAVAGVGDDARLLRAQVIAQFYEVLYLQERESIGERNLDLARRFLEAAEARFKAGQIPEIEVNVVRLEHHRARAQREEAGRETRIGRARLAALIGRPAQPDLDIKGQLGAIVVIPDRERLLLAAQTARQDLAAARAQAQGGIERARLAEALVSPDVTVGLFGERETGIIETSARTLSDRDNIIGIDLSLALPFFNQRRGERLEADVERRRADLMVEVISQDIRRDVELAVARLTAARTVIESYEREMNKLAQQNLDDLERAYKAGEVGTLEVLRAREDLSRVRAAYVDAQFGLRLALAEIEAAIGMGLSEVK